MTRVKRGFVAKKRRKKILKLTKGFRGSHSKLFQTANQQMMKALRYSYFDRKKKKNQNRQIWIRRINATSRSFGIPYNKLMNKIKNDKISLNKKVLSEIILKDIKTFNKLLTIS
uniref:ribosomal protein L20 n=1 Tax=Euglena undulata TaxID=1685799 RepID=UPI0023AAC89C|nr:ribosomal protein L20 [Euglena undulata]WCH63416.1 ribosomal protein L20 [Euglena undulata]